MAQIRECEAVLVEREKFLTLVEIKSDTAEIRNGIKDLVILKKREMGLEEKLLTRQIVPDPPPIDWHELEKMFRDVYRLDRLDYGHLGTTRDRLEHKLELQKVYIALNVKDRSFDRIMQAAKVKDLTLQQQKNLPLLFQRFDELVHLQHEKDQRIVALEKETDEQPSHAIAKKILEECKSPNLRNAAVIIDEIMSSQRMKRYDVYRILWTLSSWAIVPRPLESIPVKERFHLFIGDAGGGKSTASYWLDERFGRSRPSAPVVGISWYEARAYCRWLTEKNPGKKFRLPTEAEWEFAARGFTNRRYPWGDEPPNPKLVNFYYSKLEQTTAVGSYPPASGTVAGDKVDEQIQIFDLAGNVSEWCYDYYQEDYYKHTPMRDPVGPVTGDRRVVHGGSWLYDEGDLPCSIRGGFYPDYRSYSVGFRVACGA